MQFNRLLFVKHKLRIILLMLLCPYREILHAQWIQVADFAGGERDDLVAFTSDGRAYAGSGMNVFYAVTKDFYEYIPNTNQWELRAELPGVARQYAFSFSFDNVGCVFAGIDEFGHSLTDGYLYWPQQNSWTSLLAYPGNASRGCAAAVLNHYGYAGLGRNSNNITQQDWWQYNLDSNIWNQKASFPGVSRNLSACFEINGLIYVVGGIDEQDHALNDVWQYDPNSDTWNQVSLFLSQGMGSMASCKVKYSGVLIGGFNGQSLYTDTAFVFEGFNNSLSTISSIPINGERKGAKAFSINDELYVTCGITSTNLRLKSTWKYNQINAVAEVNDNSAGIKIYPNPANDYIEVSFPEKDLSISYTICIVSIQGKTILKMPLNTTYSKICLNDSDIAEGFYFVKIYSQETEITQKLLICK